MERCSLADYAGGVVSIVLTLPLGMSASVASRQMTVHMEFLKMRITYALVVMVAVCALVPAQSILLPTTMAGGNGQAGNMFDLNATTDISICSFDVHTSAAAPGLVAEVYTVTAGGTYVGNEANAAAWTLVGTTTFTGLGPGVVTPLNMSLGITMPAGTTLGFYVTVQGTVPAFLAYTNGTNLGGVFASDANLTFYEGAGIAYPFAATFAPRVFNGNIVYETGLTPTCAPPPPVWQTNSPASSVDVDGVLASAYGGSAANTDIVNGGPSTATLTTSLASVFDLAISLEPAYPSTSPPGLLTPGGQAVNFNLLTATFLNGGAAISFLPHPGTVTFAVTLPTGVVACGQQGVVDPGSVDGVALSQCSQVTGVTQLCVNSPTATNTAAGDDTSYLHTFAGPPMGFYGASYVDCYINSNGNITFGTGSSDFSETEGEMLSTEPRIAPAWNDWSPNVAGQVNVEESATGIVTATWYNVPEFGNAASVGSFCATMDLVTGTITTTCDAMSIQGANNALIGISPGGAISAMNNVDLTMGPNIALNATDAIYEDFQLAAFGGFDAANTTFTFMSTAAGGGSYIQQ